MVHILAINKETTIELNKIQFMANINLLHVSAPGMPSSGSLSDQINTSTAR